MCIMPDWFRVTHQVPNNASTGHSCIPLDVHASAPLYYIFLSGTHLRRFSPCSDCPAGSHYLGYPQYGCGMRSHARPLWKTCTLISALHWPYTTFLGSWIHSDRYYGIGKILCSDVPFHLSHPPEIFLCLSGQPCYH